MCTLTVLVCFLYTESPGPPSNLSLSNVTNTSALLSWSPPDNGGGRPLSEIFYTVTATGECGLMELALYSVVLVASVSNTRPAPR